MVDFEVGSIFPLGHRGLVTRSRRDSLVPVAEMGTLVKHAKEMQVLKADKIRCVADVGERITVARYVPGFVPYR